ncbi:IS3 family transposase [Vibrio sp. DW001]|uniref:IS3 family transposase n=1 Tax=Vibrio sp. DW001 TaxID=2912315 RepID=UPI0023AF2808|nr:IS3 family transposase [Vibrio sp. DW001]WED26271.1 IS3 family transposase [Vibrio sp. DW001]
MDNPTPNRARRSQRDYSLGFKLAVVNQVEKGDFTYKQAQKYYGIQGRSTVLVWLRKHGKLDWSKPIYVPNMLKSKETPAQKIKRLERQLEEEKMKNIVLNGMVDIMDKEYGAGLRKKLLIRTLWQAKEKGQVKLAPACRALGMTAQCVYQAIKRIQNRAKKLEPVRECVMYWRKYMPRIWARKLYQLIKPELEKQGIKLGRDGLFRYLREQGMLVQPRKSYTKTTNSNHWMRKHPNLLKEHSPKTPEEVFVSDITYVESEQGVHYLSLVTGAYSRKIMGYELSNEMKATDVVKALNMAVKNRQYSRNAIHHSDRGLQYCSGVYQTALTRSGIKPSMTDGYDCYQNALAERINGILKQEFLLYKCRGLDELKLLVDESIQIYNEMRPHLSLGMETPNEVHKKGQSEKLLTFY